MHLPALRKLSQRPVRGQALSVDDSPTLTKRSASPKPSADGTAARKPTVRTPRTQRFLSQVLTLDRCGPAKGGR